MYHTTFRGTPVDIYSFGCLLIDLFSHQCVWKGLSSMQIMQKVCGSHTCGPSTDHLFGSYIKKYVNSVTLDPMKRPTAESVLESLQTVHEIY